MTIEELKKKYGDETVVVIPKDVFCDMNDEYVTGWYDVSRFVDKFYDRASSMLRYEAENNEEYRQLVSYVVIRNYQTGKYFMTRRIKGDERLVGRIACVGGHMDRDDSMSFVDCAARELTEECNFDKFAETKLRETMLPIGLIARSGSEVDRVHAGVVYTVNVGCDVTINETEKLEGIWMTAQDIRNNYDMCESWVQMLIDHDVFTEAYYDAFIRDGLIDTFQRKTQDYGNAFYHSAQKLGRISCFTRMYDKVNRMKTLYTDTIEENAVNESIVDTVLDLINYCVMTAAYIKSPNDEEHYYSFVRYIMGVSFCVEEEDIYNNGVEMFNAYDVVLNNADTDQCIDELYTFLDKLIATARTLLNKRVS